MEDQRSDLKFGASKRRGFGEASAVACGDLKFVSGSNEREGRTDITSAWTSEKKPKIQSTPISGSGGIGEFVKDDDGHSSAEIAQERLEEIEGLDWDLDKLDEKIDWYRKQWWDRSLPDNDHVDFWVHCDDKQRRELNERLALYRIRAHKVSVILEHQKIYHFLLEFNLKHPLWYVFNLLYVSYMC